MYIFIPINKNAFYKVTKHYPQILNKMLHYWPVNLRVARKFTGLPPKKLDLRVARKSTTSLLPDNSSCQGIKRVECFSLDIFWGR